MRVAGEELTGGRADLGDDRRGVYRFRTHRRCCDLQFGRMSRMGQDRGSCLFACFT